jgi:hypothetical protein
LHSDVDPLCVEGLEHDFGHLLPVFWGIEGGFCQDEYGLLRIASEVVKYASVPKLFH